MSNRPRKRVTDTKRSNAVLNKSADVLHKWKQIISKYNKEPVFLTIPKFKGSYRKIPRIPGHHIQEHGIPVDSSLHLGISNQLRMCQSPTVNKNRENPEIQFSTSQKPFKFVIFKRHLFCEYIYPVERSTT